MFEDLKQESLPGVTEKDLQGFVDDSNGRLWDPVVSTGQKIRREEGDPVGKLPTDADRAWGRYGFNLVQPREEDIGMALDDPDLLRLQTLLGIIQPTTEGFEHIHPKMDVPSTTSIEGDDPLGSFATYLKLMGVEYLKTIREVDGDTVGELWEEQCRIIKVLKLDEQAGDFPDIRERKALGTLFEIINFRNRKRRLIEEQVASLATNLAEVNDGIFFPTTMFGEGDLGRFPIGVRLDIDGLKILDEKSNPFPQRLVRLDLSSPKPEDEVILSEYNDEVKVRIEKDVDSGEVFIYFQFAETLKGYLEHGIGDGIQKEIARRKFDIIQN